MPTRAIVWFKRDLRLSDHAPLTAALSCDEAAALWVAEPAWLDSPEWDAQHLRFWLDAVEPLLPAVRALGLHPLRREGDMTQVLEALYRQQAFTHLFSHEETGPGWSYERDKAVAVWCRARGVGWQEWPQTGVVRRLRSRQGWAGRWQQHMDAQPVPAPSSGGSLSGHAECRPVGAWSAGEWSPSLRARAASSRPTPPAGEAAAQQVLSSFLQHRGDGYRRALSSPLTAAAVPAPQLRRRVDAPGTPGHRAADRRTAGRGDVGCQPVCLSPARLQRPSALALPLHAEAGGRARY
ncbi:MAG: deoxyribodipyrimidine photo-lyase [Rubrivivax sp.]